MTTLISWANLAGQTVTLQFDAVESESHEDVIAVTSHAVQEGISISDHARDEPESYSLEGFVSNVPMPGRPDVIAGQVDLAFNVGAPRGTKSILLDVPSPPLQPNPTALLQAGVGALKKLATGNSKPKATVWGDFKRAAAKAQATLAKYLNGTRNRPQEVYDMLLALKSEKAFCTVQSRFRVHYDMMLTRIGVPRASELGNGLTFQLDFRRVKVAKSETVASPIPIEARGATAKDRGFQAPSTKAANTESSAQSESSLHKILF